MGERNALLAQTRVIFRAHGEADKEKVPSEGPVWAALKGLPRQRGQFWGGDPHAMILLPWEWGHLTASFSISEASHLTQNVPRVLPMPRVPHT